jgi:hypothetical protein
VTKILEVNATVSGYSAANNGRRLLSDVTVMYDVETLSTSSSATVVNNIEESVRSGEFLTTLNSFSGSYITKVSSAGSQLEGGLSSPTASPVLITEQGSVTTNLYNPGKPLPCLLSPVFFPLSPVLSPLSPLPCLPSFISSHLSPSVHVHVHAHQTTLLKMEIFCLITNNLHLLLPDL